MRTSFTPPALALALLAGATAPRALTAQLTFAPPAAPANVAAYRHVEECLAASVRVRDSVESWGGLWMDTLSVEERRKPQASFAPARDAARRCAGGLPRGDEDLADFAPWFELHLLAGHDDRAEALLERRLAAIAPDAVAERAAVLDSAANIAIGGRPLRVALAERALDLRDEHASSLRPMALIYTPFTLMVMAQVMGDHDAAVRAAARLIRLDEQATRATREKVPGRIQMLFMAHTRLVMDSALTALRTRGTDAYVAIRRESWSRASGERPEALEIPIGEAAPEIAADVWLGDRQDGGARPTKGRVALLAFVPTHCQGACAMAFATIRRLVERFPEVEVTLLASTDGQVDPLITPTVAEEAAVLRETLIAGYHLPGVLALEDAHPWYLPTPDGRRVEMPTPNEEAYSFGAGWVVEPLTVFVVDRDGTIVERQAFGSSAGNPIGEDLVRRILDILMAGQDGVAGGAR